MTIREARQVARLTQRQVAVLLEIPEVTYKSWELGKRVPPIYVEKMIIEKLQEIATVNEGEYWAATIPEMISK